MTDNAAASSSSSSSSSTSTTNSDCNIDNCSVLQLLQLLTHALPTAVIITLALATLLGLYIVADFLLRNVRFFYTQYVRTPQDLRQRYGPSSWCVITGGSDGIGLGFAVELARAGLNICIMSRSIEKLQRAEQEILSANPEVKVKLVVRDFTHAASKEFWDELWERELKGLDVSVLVNNVGINHTQRFNEISDQFLLDIVQVNCTTQMLITRKLINGMLNRPYRSAIISLSSIAGQRPLLFLSPYSATKAFNDFFSRALSLEFSHKIDFLSLRAGYVVSNMSKLTEKGGFVLDKYECARGALAKLGYVTETYGDPRHALYARSYFCLPEWILSRRREARLRDKAKAAAAMEAAAAAAAAKSNNNNSENCNNNYNNNTDSTTNTNSKNLHLNGKRNWFIQHPPTTSLLSPPSPSASLLGSSSHHTASGSDGSRWTPPPPASPPGPLPMLLEEDADMMMRYGEPPPKYSLRTYSNSSNSGVSGVNGVNGVVNGVSHRNARSASTASVD